MHVFIALVVSDLASAVEESVSDRHLRLESAVSTTHDKYSSAEQDVWVLRHTKASTPKFFLDIGAPDGSRGSNTERLEEAGWRGVCVDPVETTSFAKRRCTVVQATVVEKVDPHRSLSGCEKNTGAILPMGAAERKGPCPERANQTLVLDLLEENAIPPHIGFVSLDAGGHERELALLRTFPFDSYCSALWAIARKGYSEKKLFDMRTIMRKNHCFRVASNVDKADDLWECPLCTPRDGP